MDKQQKEQLKKDIGSLSYVKSRLLGNKETVVSLNINIEYKNDIGDNNKINLKNMDFMNGEFKDKHTQKNKFSTFILFPKESIKILDMLIEEKNKLLKSISLP